MSVAEYRRFAFEFVETNNPKQPFNKAEKMTGPDWLETFVNFLSLSL
jgi:hypothetical protein